MDESPAAYRLRAETLRSLLDFSDEGIFRMAPDGRMLMANRAAAEIFGFDSVEGLIEANNASTADLFADGSGSAGFARRSLSSRDTYRAELPIRSLDGSTAWIRVKTRSASDAREGAVVECAFARVDERRALEARVASLESVDELTGAMNRRRFLAELGLETVRAGRYGSALAVLVVDVDLFREINERRGRGDGDSALMAVRDAIARRLRSVDKLARIGGDVFAVAAPETDETGGRALAEGLRSEISALRISPGSRALDAGLGEFGVTVSVGVAAFVKGRTDGETLLNAADRALGAAKRGGRNRVALDRAPS